MPRYGEIVVACDTPGCHGSDTFSAEQLMGWAVRQLLELGGWKLQGEAWICPECVSAHVVLMRRFDAAQG